MSDSASTIWLTTGPDGPAAPPSGMSYSALLEMEACPRRWSLARASYSALWEGYGYPTNPSIAAFDGQIIHRSVERIIKLIVSSNIEAVDELAFVNMMRENGGYLAIIESEIQRLGQELAENPRLSHRRSDFEAELTGRLDALRETVQLFVSSLEIPQVTARNDGWNFVPDRSLRKGHYAEMELRSERIGWKGKVDHLKVTGDGCEIVDFKTGAEKPDHLLQMDIYDLLWNHDVGRNPVPLRVKRKTLVYPKKIVDVPPLSSEALEAFAESIFVRSTAAVAAISIPLPVAHISVSNCRFCHVRQMCASYWDQNAQESLRDVQSQESIALAKSNTDLEVFLLSSISPRVWKARVIVGMFIAPGTEILIHLGDLAGRWLDILESNSRVRLLNVFLIRSPDDEEAATPTVGIRHSSELFVVAEN